MRPLPRLAFPAAPGVREPEISGRVFLGERRNARDSARSEPARPLRPLLRSLFHSQPLKFPWEGRTVCVPAMVPKEDSARPGRQRVTFGKADRDAERVHLL
jgi:hypothetical protein